MTVVDAPQSGSQMERDQGWCELTTYDSLDRHLRRRCTDTSGVYIQVPTDTNCAAGRRL